jgi:hypothetical protein
MRAQIWFRLRETDGGRFNKRGHRRSRHQDGLDELAVYQPVTMPLFPLLAFAVCFRLLLYSLFWRLFPTRAALSGRPTVRPHGRERPAQHDARAQQCTDLLMRRMDMPQLPRRPTTLYSISSLASTDADSSAVPSSGQQSLSGGAETFSSDHDAKSIP